MTALKTFHGKCLCGKIEVATQKMNPKVGACHCSTCRKWGAGPFMGVDCGNEVSFSNQDSIAIFDSSEWAERGFCKQCGTHLFYRLKQNNQHIMPVDLFDEPVELMFDHQIFIDQKPDYYEFSNQTHNMTGEEVFAAYAPE